MILILILYILPIYMFTVSPPSQMYAKHQAFITLVLLVANLTNTERCKQPENSLKLWYMGTKYSGEWERQHQVQLRI